MMRTLADLPWMATAPLISAFAGLDGASIKLPHRWLPLLLAMACGACGWPAFLGGEIRAGTVPHETNQCEELDGLPLPLVGTPESHTIFCVDAARLSRIGRYYQVCDGDAEVLIRSDNEEL